MRFVKLAFGVEKGIIMRLCENTIPISWWGNANAEVQGYKQVKKYQETRVRTKLIILQER
jgi:hypothetical protein